MASLDEFAQFIDSFHIHDDDAVHRLKCCVVTGIPPGNVPEITVTVDCENRRVMGCEL
jgi:hypothetical protein